MNYEDIENPPVPVAEAAAPAPIPVAQPVEETKVNNSSDKQSGLSALKIYPICYSPCWYYFKFLICIYSVVTCAFTLTNYEEDCSENNPSMITIGLFCALLILWAIIGLFHFAFIVHRCFTKAPPSDHLYSGHIESKLMWPLTVVSIVIIVICIVGIIVHHEAPNETTVCLGDDDKMKGGFIKYLILSLLMCLRLGKRIGGVDA